MIIVVSGFRGSGKSLFGQVARRLRYPVFEMSEPVLRLMKELGMEITNESVRNFATDFRQKGGTNAVAKLMLPIIKPDLDAGRAVVVIGARSIEEVEVFRTLAQTVLIGITSSEKTRFERTRERNKASDPKKIANFKWADEVEAKWGLKKLMENCDARIENNGGEEEFREKVKAALARYK